MTGRTDERPPRQVFLVARLFADEHQRSVGRAFARDALGGVAPQVAAAADLNPGPDLVQAGRNPVSIGDVARRARPALGRAIRRGTGRDGDHGDGGGSWAASIRCGMIRIARGFRLPFTMFVICSR
jgi:hypothetical protein